MRRYLEITFISIIVIIGLFLLFNNQIAGFILNHNYPELTKSEIREAKQVTPKINRDIDELTNQEIFKNAMSDKKALYIGYLSIPSMSLHVPVVNELSNYAVSVGAGVYYPEMNMGEGNYVLASHFWWQDETALFSPLYYHVDEGANGQEVYLTDLEYLYTYKTKIFKVVSIDETELIQDNKAANPPKITLFTCNYSSDAGRVVLQGELIKKEKLDKVDKSLVKEITSKD